MKPIAFSGMMCNPIDIQKEGDYRIKGIINRAKDMPELVRFEYFANKYERDKRFDHIMKLRERNEF